MTEEAQAAYVSNLCYLIFKCNVLANLLNVSYTGHAMILIILQNEMNIRKMGPRQEDEAEKSDMQIVEEVLKEHSSSSTFLGNLGVASSSRMSTTSHTRIRELEERLAHQEQEARDATSRYEQDLSARLQAQQQEIEELRRKQQEELEALKKSHEEKTLAVEKRQQEMDVLLGYLLRTSRSSQGDKSTAPPC